MRQTKRGSALLRAIGVICAVAVIVSGVTFAALQSQNVTLQGSTITSATANLLISDGQGDYSTTASGYNFANIEPGGQPMPTVGNSLVLRNAGTSNLALHIAMNPTNFANPDSANVDRIYLILTPLAGGQAQQLPLSSLLAAYSTNLPLALNLTLPAGQIGQYSLQIQMAGDSVTSTQSGVALSGIDFVFSGTSVTS